MGRQDDLVSALHAYESRNVTFTGDGFPIFWESAAGSTVTGADGKRYIDLTAGFGVANCGHGNARVANAVARQAHTLMHAMGDVHPARVKVDLLARLAQITPSGLRKTILASSGADAIEAAMKTAMMATSKPAFAAFRGSYHGLSIGTLEVAGIKKFREPFLAWLPERTLLLDYPREGDSADRALEYARRAFLRRYDLAALIVEPVQGRGGCIVPPKEYLAGLRAICKERGMLFICDEIYTGFGRTGALFASMRENVEPDILCIGKALGNGFPISAAVGTADVMDAWPASRGEALHTSTHLGNPMGCAAALAAIDEIVERDLPARAEMLGDKLRERFSALASSRKIGAAHGRGLMWGVELPDAQSASRVAAEALAKGVIVLQSGTDGNILSITPPLVIEEEELGRALDIVESCIK